MKNPFLYGYIPFITIFLFSLTFGVFSVNTLLDLLKGLGLYTGMREFLSDLQLRIFLLIICSLCVFMILAALKLLAETVHELGMLFFAPARAGNMTDAPRSGYVILFFGSLASVAGIGSLRVLLGIFLVSLFLFFVYVLFRLSAPLGMGRTMGLLTFEVLAWSAAASLVVYAGLRIYNGLLNSLPVLQ